MFAITTLMFLPRWAKKDRGNRDENTKNKCSYQCGKKLK